MKATRREWIGLGVLTLPTLLISLDMTVLHLALPRIAAELRPSAPQQLWILDIYGFFIAGFLVTMGTLGDRIGRRKLLLAGSAAFGVASLLAAFAPTAETLIVARALLGVAGATLMPSTMSLIRNMFLDDGERTRALAVWMTGFMVGGAIGPLVGGLLLEFFTWGSVFLMNVPIMVLLLIAGPILLPEYRDPSAGRMDFLSVVLSLATVLPVIYGMKEIAAAGVQPASLLTVAAGGLFGVLFVRRQGRLADPLIDMGLFRNRRFSVSLGSLMLGIVAFGGIMFFIAQYLQLVLGMSPLEAGLWTLPQAVAMLISMQVAPRFIPRFRPAVVMGWSMGIAVVGFFLVAQATLLTIISGFVIMSVGFAPWLLVALDMIIGAAPPERAGAASAVSEMGQEFGMAFGLAALGSIGTAIYRGSLTEALPSGVPPAALENLAGALAAAAELPGTFGTTLVSAARSAFTEGLQITSTIGIGLFAIGAVVVVTLMRHLPAPGSEPNLEPELELDRV